MIPSTSPSTGEGNSEEMESSEDPLVTELSSDDPNTLSTVKPPDPTKVNLISKATGIYQTQTIIKRNIKYII